MSEENNEIICQICGKSCFDFRGLGIHLGKIHSFNKKEYYDLYLIKDENEHLCKRCKKNSVRFISLKRGYADCCIKCSPLKIKETKFKNHGDENYTNRKQAKETCLDKYGVEYTGQVSSKILKTSENWKNKTEEELNKIRNKREQTCIEKYGETDYSKTKECKEKIKDTSNKKYNCNHFLQSSEIMEKRIQTNLQKYGVEHVLQNEDIKNKSKITCLTSYGVDHYTKTDEFIGRIKATKLERYGDENYNNREKAEQTCLKNYGVSCYLKSPNRYKNMFDKYGVYYPSQLQWVQNKIKNTCITKYGVDHHLKSLEIIEKREITNLNRYGVRNPGILCSNFYSKISQELFWLLYKQLPENLQQDCYFAELNKERFISIKNNYFLFDFCILSKKLFIEFNGDYWHRNPKFYEITEENIAIWEQNEFKKQVAEEQGFKVLYVWESDYKQNKEKIVKECLQFLIFN